MLCSLLLVVLPLHGMKHRYALLPLRRMRGYILVDSPAGKENFTPHAPRKRVVIFMSIEIVNAYFQLAAGFFYVEQFIDA